jgi:hypothetical protein
MRTKSFLKHLILGALMLTTGKVDGQVTTTGNLAGATSDFLGWSNNSPANDFPLMVRHNGNWPIQWFTDNTLRMHLNQTLLTQTVNGYPNLNLTGHLGLGTIDPATFLHINNGGQVLTGYRPWMRTGTLMTEQSDMMYVGTKREAIDRIDAVINWADNNEGSPSGPDALRFIFTRPPTGGATAAGVDGLELARIIPATNANEGFFGIGNFFTAGVNPDERLDLLDGRVRIRQLPTEAEMDSTLKVVVVNEDGVLGWLDATGVPTQDQAWLTQGNANIVAGTHFLGTTNAAPVDLRTDSIHRMRLLPDAMYDIGPFTNQEKNGNLLLSPDVEQFYANSGPGPYSLLHLADADDNAQQWGYRPWMRNGITLTGNKDEMYMGQLYRDDDITDAVICWSDNPGMARADRFTLRFTSAHDPMADEGSASEQGMQTMVVQPQDDGIQAFTGFGDFDAVAEVPEERIDILDGRVRIRELPEASGETTSTYKVMVVDDAASPSGERGVVKWIDPNDLPGGDDCDWVVQDPIPHVSTVYNGSTCDWTMHHGVGVGVQLPKSKLHVAHREDSLLAPIALLATSQFDYDNYAAIYGMYGVATGAVGSSPILDMRAFGVYGEASSGRSAVGVMGHADHLSAPSGMATETYGVVGLAIANGNSDHCVGVYGAGYGAADTANTWAGWFEGKVKITTGLFVDATLYTSDANLKTNVADLEGALDIVNTLAPKTYEFIEQAHPSFDLPTGSQIGLLAQDVEAVLPELVASTSLPAKYDTLGNQIAEPVTYKALNYVGLIPVLIGAVKDQQEQIAEQQSANAVLADQMNELRGRMDQLEAALAACCTAPGSDDGERSGALDEDFDPATERLLTIAPNPFTDQTTVSYTLERGGRAQLLVNSSDGKHLQVLEEAARSEGQYSYAWSTAHLAPGIYYVTLLLDGEPLVKRAVKVR